MLGQRLSQKLQQKLSPQQIQLMKLLQIPTANLEQRIEEELEANPALEEGEAFDNVVEDFQKDATRDKKEDGENEYEQDSYDDFHSNDIDLNDYFEDDDVGSYKYQANNYNPEDEDRSVPIALNTTFHEYLTQQLGTQELGDDDYIIAQQIIGSIDDDGYLRRELEDIVDDLAFSQSVSTTEEKIEELLAIIQGFDPAGIGARNLKECLLLQLYRKEDEENKLIETAVKILKNHFDQFTKKHYNKLCSAYNLNDEELKEVLDEILKLNPKPASGYSSGNTTKQVHYIIPDFIIRNDAGTLELSLNSRNAPELKVSKNFIEMMQDYKDSAKKTKQQKDAILFVKQKIDSAKWFIDAIRQRQQTMLKTMHAIMEYQEEYLLTGDETKLRPMILKDIAEITNLDISTVSRVANSKYVQTEFGTLLLKFFFSESLQTQDGDEVSTREVKKILSNVIEKEDKKKPYSDQKLMEILIDKGYNIARRTVAKYREQLSIPVARLRKEL